MINLLKTILIKIQLIEPKTMELDLEALTVWIFILITAFRALFAGATFKFGSHLVWSPQDANIGITLPILYSMLSNANRLYVNKSDKGDNNA